MAPQDREALNADPFLQTIVRACAESGTSVFKIRLFVGAAVLSGRIIDSSRFWKGYADLYLARGFEGCDRLADYLNHLGRSVEADITELPSPSTLPEFICLADVQVHFAGERVEAIPLLRVRLSQVAGFALEP